MNLQTLIISVIASTIAGMGTGYITVRVTIAVMQNDISWIKGQIVDLKDQHAQDVKDLRRRMAELELRVVNGGKN